MTATLAQIRAAAETLANAHNDTSGCAALLQAEIKNAIAPILARYKATLDGYAAAEAVAHKNLEELLIANPQLFKKPRSLSIDGVRCGYIKAADTLDWADDAAVIARIKALREDLAPVLIRTQESLVVDALAGVDAKDLVGFGVRTITGADNIFITVGDNDAEKLTKLVIAAAASRQGEEDKPKAARGKAKVGKAVAA
ncbi:MAG: hypothetical protein PHQ05_10240 [Sterolibacterium sp.]|nr:hypothetical protein [Sterolibacterium sp.]